MLKEFRHQKYISRGDLFLFNYKYVTTIGLMSNDDVVMVMWCDAV